MWKRFTATEKRLSVVSRKDGTVQAMSYALDLKSHLAVMNRPTIFESWAEFISFAAEHGLDTSAQRWHVQAEENVRFVAKVRP